MKKLGILTLITTILMSSTFVYADDIPMSNIKQLSLDLAITEAIKNSNDIKTSDLDIEIKEIELDQAKRNEKKYKDLDYSLGTIEGFQLDSNMLSKKAKYALEEEKIKKDYKIENLKYNVTKYYYLTLQARDYLNVANSNLENIKRNRDEAKKKFNLGMTSKSDVIMAEISLDEAKSSVEKAKLNFEKALRALNITLNYPLDTRFKFTSNFSEQSFNTDLNKDLEKAYEVRFDIVQLNHNYDLVKLDFETNSIKYPSNTYNYKYKERAVSKVGNILNDAKRGVEFDIRSKYDAIYNAKKQIDLSKSNVERAQEALRLRELAYNSGMGTLLEVKQATTQLYTAKVDVSRALSNYNLSILEYDKAVNIGTIK
ncbi:TolC family protein [Tepidibacter hydrothermalis]|uniref:TolC family protein n=1 Tax=Tepidibacter hydrothermalis TaxID=3036126 RepID=A0ABY8EF04_9FIRM|nr:TolC family protein [Tepidibacter hydrothermalis]WFD09405.1 TolC family protein [Tepidibacter hydrothermalis]